MIALAAALLVAGALPALECPAGTERRGAPPPEGSEEWCEGKDPTGVPRRDGPARRFYEDGRVWIEASYRDGELDGRFVEYHRSGAKAREGAYAVGRKTGTWTVRGETGRLEEESHWRDDVAHGAYASFWPNGARRAEGRHCGGAQCGTWRAFDEAGREIGTIEYGEQRLSP